VTGAVIQQVLPGSAAAQVGLQRGDLIIGVDGVGVSGPAEVVQRVGHHAAGERVTLVILRPDGRGGVQQFQVTPVLQPGAGLPAPDAAGRRPGGGDVESTYNQQLGMESAHDPATGENYWVSHGTDWNETGPEGPGVYRQSGNDRRKLVPGRSE
jgi:membrane-associated protease RseP (regulator of RpoE activity)